MLCSIRMHCADLLSWLGVRAGVLKTVLGRFSLGLIASFLAQSWLPVNAFAELRNWGGSFEVSSVGSVEDKVLWNLRPTFNLKGDQPFFDSRVWSLGVDLRLRADTQANFARSESRYDFRIDKATLQWVGQSAAVNLGWQKFTWGDTGFLDGVDVLNARDLSEPLYADDELQKLAVPALSLQYLASSTVFQLVVIPQPERSPFPENSGAVPLPDTEPFGFGEQFEFGLKAGGLLSSGWDINGYLVSHIERVPQLRLIVSPQQVEARLFEPRVFTLGLTATQSFGALVFRSEGAIHINRALPEPGLQSEVSSDQFVINLSSDLTLFDDLLMSGQIWAEQWTAASSSEFSNANVLLGARVQKPLFSNRFDFYLGVLGSFASNENLINSGFKFMAFDSWQVALDVYFAETSKGHALARRQFKDLIRSSLKYQF